MTDLISVVNASVNFIGVATILVIAELMLKAYVKVCAVLDTLK